MDNIRRNRKPLRLENYDYAANGIYFITICTHGKEKTLCSILRRGDPCGLPRTELSELGTFAEETIREIEVAEAVTVDKYVIMPNHVHLLIILSASTPDSRKEIPLLGEMLRSDKRVAVFAENVTTTFPESSANTNHWLLTNGLPYANPATGKWGKSGSAPTTTILSAINKTI